MRLRALALLLVTVAGLLGCARAEITLPPERGDSSSPVGPGGSRSAGDDEDDEDDEAVEPDEIAFAAIEDAQEFWAEAFPTVYDRPYEELRGGTVPYGPNSDLPTCGDTSLDYEELAGNAFYCPRDDLIAWDSVNLLPDLLEEFGPFSIAIVIAHEVGHAVQSRADVRASGVTLELQADCFAGAWAGHVAEGGSSGFELAADELDLSLAGILELRDGIGTAASDPNAHGSGFDRVSAFQDGFQEGPGRCGGYEEDPPVVVQIPFNDFDDRLSGGNLPTEELLEPLVLDLESFYTALAEGRGLEWDPVDEIVPVDGELECDGDEVDPDVLAERAVYCEADDAIYLDTSELLPALEEIGDFAVAGEVARQYGYRAEQQLVDDGGDADATVDCLTGAYAGEEFAQTIPQQQLALSPGDLDEIIIAFLVFGGDDGRGAFERTAAFRAGFFEGADACLA